MAEGESNNIYSDSRYAFATAHVHGTIYRQRGLFTSVGKEVKNKEILSLLEALRLSKRQAFIHCLGHQETADFISKKKKKKKKQMADQVTKQAAQSLNLLLVVKKSKIPGPGWQYTLGDWQEIKR
jgi:ribonuclease HI